MTQSNLATHSNTAGALSNGVRDSVLQAIGNTPVVRLRKVVTPGMADVLVKLEYYNPTGSYKDRMALAMIEGAAAELLNRPHPIPPKCPVAGEHGQLTPRVLAG